MKKPEETVRTLYPKCWWYVLLTPDPYAIEYALFEHALPGVNPNASLSMEWVHRYEHLVLYRGTGISYHEAEATALARQVLRKVTWE